MIGIRREDKSRWEARAPLTPEDVRRLSQEHGLRFHVQSSPIRRFKDEEYRAAGASVGPDLRECPIVLGVKEIPPALLEPNKTYVFFSHTIKRQPANMPMLRRLAELGCTLIDYERIVDGQNRRLVFFGRYAGLAGMIDTLWALGQRLEVEGLATPLLDVRRAYEYHDLKHAEAELSEIGARIERAGLPEALRPLVFGFTGYGNVSQGAQHIADLMGLRTIAPDELAGVPAGDAGRYKVVFHEEHMVALRDEHAAPGPFDVQDYYKRPERYRPRFFEYARRLTVLVNGIYWEPKYPRYLTRPQFQDLYAEPHPRLRVIGDITCDLDGSIACTTRCTEPDRPVYVYDPFTGQTHDGVAGQGPVVLAVDFLPCELPADASAEFGRALRPFLPALARADLDRPLPLAGLPPELERATILYRGKLTEPYRYLEVELK